MGKNGYLQRRDAAQQAILEIGEQMGMQKLWDYMQLALRDPNVMGKDVFGRKRMEKLYARLKELADTYHTAFTDDKEADVYQKKLDDNLREIWENDLSEFRERYPYIKQFGYQKARKGWN